MKRAVSTAFALLVLGRIAMADPASSPGIVACVKVDDAGTVSGVYLLVSSGNKDDDEALLSYFRGLKWAPKKPGDAPRNVWVPMGVALGGKQPPRGPETCGPPGS